MRLRLRPNEACARSQMSNHRFKTTALISISKSCLQKVKFPMSRLEASGVLYTNWLHNLYPMGGACIAHFAVYATLEDRTDGGHVCATRVIRGHHTSTLRGIN